MTVLDPRGRVLVAILGGSVAVVRSSGGGEGTRRATRSVMRRASQRPPAEEMMRWEKSKKEAMQLGRESDRKSGIARHEASK